MYIAHLMLPLVKCMASLVDERSLIYLAYYERSAAAAKQFWEILPKYFTFEKVLEERYGASFHPSDVGVFQLRLIPEHMRKEGTPADVVGPPEGPEEEALSQEGTPVKVAGSAESPEEEASSLEGTPANVVGPGGAPEVEASSREGTPANMVGPGGAPEVEASSREGTPANVAGSTEGADGEASSKEQVKDEGPNGGDVEHAARHSEEEACSQGQLQGKQPAPGVES